MTEPGRNALLITVWNHSKVRSKILTNSSYSNVGQRLLLEILPNFLSLFYSTKSNIFFCPYAFDSFLICVSVFIVYASPRLTLSPHTLIYKLQLMVLERKGPCFLIHSLRFISVGTAPPLTPPPWEEHSLIISESPNWDFPIAHILSSFQYVEASLL